MTIVSCGFSQFPQASADIVPIIQIGGRLFPSACMYTSIILFSLLLSVTLSPDVRLFGVLEALLIKP
jgi:hypothetical protein